MSDTYDMKAYCPNCRMSRVVQIPKGVTVKDCQKAEPANLQCPNCGCQGIRFSAIRTKPTKGAKL